MVYSADLILVASVLAAGFSASWIGFEVARMAGWRQPAVIGEASAGPADVFLLLLTALIGPRLLMAHGFARWRRGAIPFSSYAIVLLIVVGWSALSGIIVLQLAFASGLFLA